MAFYVMVAFERVDAVTFEKARSIHSMVSVLTNVLSKNPVVCVAVTMTVN